MKKETKQKILVVMFVLSLIVVWGQSCIGKEKSEAASDVLVDIIKPLEEIKPDEIHTVEYEYYNHLIRKGAHVVEFFVIGVEIAFIILLFSKKKQSLIIVFINSVMTGMLIGLIDETIQVFSNRGTQVSDIWFDIIGTSIGTIAAFIVYVVKKKKKGLAYEEDIDNRS